MRGGDDNYEHHVHGPVHEVTPLDAAEEAIEEALAHERDTCQAHRIILDLTRLDDVGEGTIGIIVEHVSSDDERYAVRLSEGVSQRLVRRLIDAGLEPRLIAGESGIGPHHVESPPD